MVTIHLCDPDDERSPLEFPGLTLVELFRKPRVVGDAVLLEPRPGMLVNLAHVELIYDSEAPDPVELTTEEAVAALEDEREYGAPPGVELCRHGYVKDTCSICTPAFTGVPQYRGKP